MSEYGIWSDLSGEIIESGFPSVEKAEEARDKLLALTYMDTWVRLVCPDHEGQPLNGCEGAH